MSVGNHSTPIPPPLPSPRVVYAVLIRMLMTNIKRLFRFSDLEFVALRGLDKLLFDSGLVRGVYGASMASLTASASLDAGDDGSSPSSMSSFIILKPRTRGK